MALISLVEHDSEVSEPFQGRRLTHALEASTGRSIGRKLTRSSLMNTTQEQYDQQQNYDLEKDELYLG